MAENRPQRIAALVADYHAYNRAIEQTRLSAQSMAKGKSWTLGQMRQMMNVAEIADVLGISQPAVYAGLGEEVPGRSPEDREALLKQLGVMGSQIQRIADGKTSLISPNPVGMQMLADVLRWAEEFIAEQAGAGPRI